MHRNFKTSRWPIERSNLKVTSTSCRMKTRHSGTRTGVDLEEEQVRAAQPRKIFNDG